MKVLFLATNAVLHSWMCSYRFWRRRSRKIFPIFIAVLYQVTVESSTLGSSYQIVIWNAGKPSALWNCKSKHIERMLFQQRALHFKQGPASLSPAKVSTDVLTKEPLQNQLSTATWKNDPDGLLRCTNVHMSHKRDPYINQQWSLEVWGVLPITSTCPSHLGVDLVDIPSRFLTFGIHKVFLSLHVLNKLW